MPSDLAISFAPSVWGTVGQWVAAIGTVLAFTATFYVIRRDAGVRRRAQARKVVLYVVQTPREPAEIEGKHRIWYDLTVRNLSDEPIYDVTFWMVRPGVRRSGRKSLRDNLNSTEVLLPDGVLSRRGSGSGAAYGTVDVMFRDNAGYQWRRSVRGQLMYMSRLDLWMFRRFYDDNPIRWVYRDLQRRRHNKQVQRERIARRAERQRLRELNDTSALPDDQSAPGPS